MDRRRLRAIVALVAVAVVGAWLLTSGEPGGRRASATSASGGPDASMAGPTSPKAIGPTATPGSKPAPTPKPTMKPSSNAPVAPKQTPKPGPNPTPTPTPNPTPHPMPTPKPAPCTLFPSSNVWNERVDDLPVASNSAAMIAAIGLGAALHPDFSSLAWNGGRGY